MCRELIAIKIYTTVTDGKIKIVFFTSSVQRNFPYFLVFLTFFVFVFITMLSVTLFALRFATNRIRINTEYVE